MCNVLLRDPTNAYWQLGVLNTGQIETTKVDFQPLRVNAPILAGSVKAWTLSATSLGNIVASPTNFDNSFALPYIPMQAPNGKGYKLTILDGSGQLETTGVTVLPADFIPTPIDISMSNFPVSDGVICYSCGNASVTVRGDLSLWCCACNSFVLPEDTNVIVILDE